QVERPAGVGDVEAGDEVIQVARGERHDRRVEHGGARALVLAELSVDLARDREVAEVGLQRQPERVLVSRIRVGVEQADRDTLDAAGAPRAARPFSTAAAGLAGVDGTLHEHIAPDGSRATRSVKVPPTSTPIRTPGAAVTGTLSRVR